MSTVTLKRISTAYGWHPSGWHYALAEHIPAMAVVGIFRHAIVQRPEGRTEGGILYFHSADLAKRAQHFLPHVKKVLGDVSIAAARQDAQQRGDAHGG